MLLLKRAKNGLSHFLLQAHASSMWAFKGTLWYLFKIGFLLLNFVMESIKEYFSTEGLRPWILIFLLQFHVCCFSSLCAH